MKRIELKDYRIWVKPDGEIAYCKDPTIFAPVNIASMQFIKPDEPGYELIAALINCVESMDQQVSDFFENISKEVEIEDDA